MDIGIEAFYMDDKSREAYEAGGAGTYYFADGEFKVIDVLFSKRFYT